MISLFRRRVSCKKCGLHLIGERQKAGTSITDAIAKCAKAPASARTYCGFAAKTAPTPLRRRQGVEGVQDLAEVERKNVTAETDKLRAR